MKLKEIRLAAKKTQGEVAQAVNITQNTYSNYENGKTEPSIATLVKLADFYKVTVDELLGHKVPYLMSKVDFSSSQLEVVEKVKNLNETQCLKVMAYIEGMQDGKKE